jgi:hypothetical protein
MKASDRLRTALLALARGAPLTEAQQKELEETGWGDATARDAQRELEAQAQRQAGSGRAGVTLSDTGFYSIDGLRAHGTPAEWAQAEQEAREGLLWLVVDPHCPFHTDWLATADSAGAAIAWVGREEDRGTEGLTAQRVAASPVHEG